MEKNLNEILAGLNEEQGRAVRQTDGPVLIVAGAGSGKTRVLTSRIAYLLSRGVPSDRIMALTFTKRAAEEMKQRIASIVGKYNARGLVMGTFHSVFVRFLREYSSFLGYPDNFTIYDVSDQLSALKSFIGIGKFTSSAIVFNEKEYPPRKVLSRISNAKSALYTSETYPRSPMVEDDRRMKMPDLHKLYTLYQQKLKQSGAMDFDDILLNMNILLRDNPEALQSISSRFDYILVDEYQDTNFAQYKIVLRLASKHRNITVVGDDSQSIYAFRGAMVQNIINFKADFPECKTFRLELNYRSTPVIVDAANSLIEHNTNRIKKTCVSASTKSDAELIHIIRAWNDTDEAMHVVSDILAHVRNCSARYEDFAILYRTNNQSRVLEDNLRRRNVPYIIYSGHTFYERAEVKDLMAYFKLACNPLDDESFKRVVNRPVRGIGDTTLAALGSAAQVHKTTLYRAVYLDEIESFWVKPRALALRREFCQMIDAFHSKLNSTPAYELADEIYHKSGMYDFLRSDDSVQGQSRVGNADELVNAVQAYVDERNEEFYGEHEAYEIAPSHNLHEFLENTQLLSNADCAEGENDGNRVTLMTVHASKGLEFPYVYVTGLEEDLFPSQRSSTIMDIEEERRLFYVAITRAEKEVVFSFADQRLINGKASTNPPSRFLSEVSSEYIRPSDRHLVERNEAFLGGGGKWKSNSFTSTDRRSEASSSRPFVSHASKSSQTSALNAPKPPIIDPDFKAVHPSKLYVGQRVEHNRFGAGVILRFQDRNIEGVKPKVIIKFDNYTDDKTLLLGIAKLRPEKK